MKQTGRWAHRSLTEGAITLALTVGLTTQAGAATTWTTFQSNPAPVSIADVAASPDGSTWGAGHRFVSGVGYTPVVQHLERGEFQSVPLPSDWQGWWSEIDASSTHNVWAFGANESGTNLAGQWDGTAWRRFTLPGGSSVTDSTAISASDVWTVSQSATARRWDGTTWSTETLPIEANAVDGTSASNVWAAGSRRDADDIIQPAAAVWNGSTWTDISPDGVANDLRSAAEFRDLSVVSPTDVWAVGSYTWLDAEQNSHTQPLLAHYTDGTWSMWKHAEGWAYESVVHDRHGGVHILYGSGDPTVLHIRDGVWTESSLPHVSGHVSTATSLERNPLTGTVWTSGWYWSATDLAADGKSTYWRRLAA